MQYIRTFFGAGLVLAVAAFMTIVGLADRAAAQDNRSRVMLVLDASGSMWGRVEGRPKIEVARDVIRELLEDWDTSIDLGLSAYGHRTKGECTDIETLRPVGPVNAAEIMKVVGALTPKGKTPLSEAVRRAAEELRYSEERATVILVSDGIETCEADPCAIARSLEEAGVDFTVHVVGFDLKKEEQESLRCLAENTGGQFLAAENAGGLQDALRTTVTRVKEEAAKTVEVKKPQPQPEPTGKPGHRFEAVMAEGGPPVEKGMRWDIYEARADADGKRKHINGNYDTKPIFKLNAGRYLVVAKWGNAVASKEFDVGSVDDRERHTIVLDAGVVALDAVLIEGQDPVAKGMRWDIYKAEKDVDGNREHVNGNYDSATRFSLNIGTYFVVAKNGNAVASGEVTIPAGKRVEQTFVLNAGLAVFEATYDEEGQPVKKGMRWDVYSADKDLDGNRQHFNGNYDTKPQFMLPAGKYHVVAKLGNASLARDIDIVPGKRNEAVFVLNAGITKLSAVFSEGGETIAKGMRWDIYGVDKDLEGKRKHFDGNYDSTPIFTLTEGRYHVVVKNGSAVKSGEIEIKAGKLSDPVFNLDGGRVKLVARAATGNEVSSGLRWDIYTAEKNLEGKRAHIDGNYEATPIFTLGAGKYVAIVKVGDASAEFEFDVAAGDSKQVEVPMQ